MIMLTLPEPAAPQAADQRNNGRDVHEGFTSRLWNRGVRYGDGAMEGYSLTVNVTGMILRGLKRRE